MEEKDYFMSVYGQGYGDFLYLTSLYGQAGIRIMMGSNGVANDFVVKSKKDLISIAEFLLQHCNVNE